MSRITALVLLLPVLITPYASAQERSHDEEMNVAANMSVDDARAATAFAMRFIGHGGAANITLVSRDDAGNLEVLEDETEAVAEAARSLVASGFCRMVCPTELVTSCRIPTEKPGGGQAQPEALEATARFLVTSAGRSSCRPTTLDQARAWKKIFGPKRLGDSEGRIYSDEGEQNNPTIPAGYTFYGQFIDHDMTAALVALGTAPAVTKIATGTVGMPDATPAEAGVSDAEDEVLGALIAGIITGYGIDDAAAPDTVRTASLIALPPGSLEPNAPDAGTRVTLDPYLAGKNRRTSSLDLDSVYGPYRSFGQIYQAAINGKADILRMYEQANGYFTGRLMLHPKAHESGLIGFDVERMNGKGAIIGDGRNDENILVFGIHTLFIRLHNDCIDFYTAASGRERPDGATLKLPVSTAFDRCRDEVPWVHQTIVLTDYLPRTLNPEQAKRLLVNDDDGDAPEAATLPAGDSPTFLFYAGAGPGDARVPEEFAVAGFRHGHSQLQSGYRLRATDDAGAARMLFTEQVADEECDLQTDLSGNCEIGSIDVIDWGQFFAVGSGTPQASRLIDLKLPEAVGRMPVKALPPAPVGIVKRNDDGSTTVTIEEPKDTASEQNLARRNILRAAGQGTTFNDPDGSIELKGAVDLPSLDPFVMVLEQTTNYRVDAPGIARRLNEVLQPPEELDGSTIPLWLGILAEAEVQEEGRRLGTLGSMIVGETIHGAVMYDPRSVLNVVAADPAAHSGPNVWEPVNRIATERHFDFPDLVRHLSSQLADGMLASGL